MSDDTLIFEVVVDGHSYKIFAAGRVEGFVGEKIWISNHFFSLMDKYNKEFANEPLPKA